MALTGPWRSRRSVGGTSTSAYTQLSLPGDCLWPRLRRLCIESWYWLLGLHMVRCSQCSLLLAIFCLLHVGGEASLSFWFCKNRPHGLLPTLSWLVLESSSELAHRLIGRQSSVSSCKTCQSLPLLSQLCTGSFLHQDLFSADGTKAGVASEGTRAAFGAKQMSLEEASRILGVERSASMEEVVKVC